MSIVKNKRKCEMTIRSAIKTSVRKKFLRSHTTNCSFLLETYISPYLLFFFSTMRSQMSSTCSVFKSCTSWPRILLSSTLGKKRQPSSSELLMHATRLWALRVSLAPYKGSATVLRTLTTWSLSCLAQFSYSVTETKVDYTTASYTYIYTGK